MEQVHHGIHWYPKLLLFHLHCSLLEGLFDDGHYHDHKVDNAGLLERLDHGFVREVSAEEDGDLLWKLDPPRCLYCMSAWTAEDMVSGREEFLARPSVYPHFTYQMPGKATDDILGEVRAPVCVRRANRAKKIIKMFDERKTMKNKAADKMEE